MKKSIIILIISITTLLNSYSQITLENSFTSKLSSFQLEDGSFKYSEIYEKDKILSIFNMDKTKWQTIHFDNPKNHYLGEIKLISQNTFNTNNQLEVLYTNYKIFNEYEYEGMEDVFTENLYTMKFINGTGKKLLKIPGGKEYKILNTNLKSELMVYIADMLGINNSNSTLIY